MPTPTAAMPLTLEVRRAEQAAADIFVFELRHPEGSDLPEFTAGSHLTVRSPNGSLRKYSLCNDPAERDRYVIGVKRDPAGRGGSVDLVDHVHACDTAQGSPPRNAFDLHPPTPA